MGFGVIVVNNTKKQLVLPNCHTETFLELVQYLQSMGWDFVNDFIEEFDEKRTDKEGSFFWDTDGNCPKEEWLI
jgi:hypothetical protein